MAEILLRGAAAAMASLGLPHLSYNPFLVAKDFSACIEREENRKLYHKHTKSIPNNLWMVQWHTISG